MFNKKINIFLYSFNLKKNIIFLLKLYKKIMFFFKFLFLFKFFIKLPLKQSKYTILIAPHADKKAREQYSYNIYKKNTFILYNSIYTLYKNKIKIKSIFFYLKYFNNILNKYFKILLNFILIKLFFY